MLLISPFLRFPSHTRCSKDKSCTLSCNSAVQKASQTIWKSVGGWEVRSLPKVRTAHILCPRKLPVFLGTANLFPSLSSRVHFVNEDFAAGIELPRVKIPHFFPFISLQLSFASKYFSLQVWGVNYRIKIIWLIKKKKNKNQNFRCSNFLTFRCVKFHEPFWAFMINSDLVLGDVTTRHTWNGSFALLVLFKRVSSQQTVLWELNPNQQQEMTP